MADHGVDRRGADVRGPQPVFECVQTVRAAVRGLREGRVTELHRAVITHPRRYRNILRLQTGVGVIAAVYMANDFSSLDGSRVRSSPVPGMKMALRLAVSGFPIDTAP